MTTSHLAAPSTGGMTSTESDTELQLIRLVKEGNHAAMKMMYSRYVRLLAALCSRYIPNDEDVKDVLQDTFIKIFSGMASFKYRGTGSLKAWMTKITINEILMFLRLCNHFEFVEISEDRYELADEDPDIETLPSEIIMQMIRELPDGYRTVFNLYVIENKSHKEIAALMGIKESTSASQLHRAKSILAFRIRQYNKTSMI